MKHIMFKLGFHHQCILLHMCKCSKLWKTIISTNTCCPRKPTYNKWEPLSLCIFPWKDLFKIRNLLLAFIQNPYPPKYYIHISCIVIFCITINYFISLSDVRKYPYNIVLVICSRGRKKKDFWIFFQPDVNSSCSPVLLFLTPVSFPLFLPFLFPLFKPLISSGNRTELNDQLSTSRSVNYSCLHILSVVMLSM